MRRLEKRMRKSFLRGALTAFTAWTCTALIAHNAHADLSTTKPVRIGASSGPGKTSAFGANGMDGGIPWVDGLGRTQVIFGDTSSATNRLCSETSPLPETPDPNWPYPPHRISVSSTIAWTTDNYLLDGISYTDMLRDGPYFTPAILNTGHTVPSGAVAVGLTDLVHFASTSLPAGMEGFECDNLAVAFGFIGTRTATPDGQGRFVRNDAFGWWGATSNFAQGSLLKRGNFVYLFGITAGRSGGVKLARAQIHSPLTGLSWEYWSGTTWSSDEPNAGFIVPPSVGELSAAYNETLGRFVLAYFDDQSGSVVYRDARTPEGPWSEQKTLLTQTDSPALYGSFIFPFDRTGDPTALFFNVSNWQKAGGTHDCLHSTLYNTSLYRTSLSYKAPATSTSAGALVTDAGFDTYLCTPTVARSCQEVEFSKMLSARSGKWLPIPLVQREWDTGPLVRNPEVEVVRAHLTAPIRVRLTAVSVKIVVA